MLGNASDSLPLPSRVSNLLALFPGSGDQPIDLVIV